MALEVILTIGIVFMSVVVHEISHGYAAHFLGDPTAKYQGRLTLNPIPHIDILGTILVPLFLILSQAGILFGWAKPVPYNPYNLRGGAKAEAFVAAAGSLSNFALAIIFGILAQVVASVDPSQTELVFTFTTIVFVNVLLGLFNLLPIPPLDGSKVLLAILPMKIESAYKKYIINPFERMGFLAFFLVVFIFIFLLAQPFFLFVNFVTSLLVGG
ncbi:MAG: site-2 protease family protein [Candidatus Campbellbacteria bacterium]|nr:site-2 protease family protein [Candidatus Campbellbacteria bacterium]